MSAIFVLIFVIFFYLTVLFLTIDAFKFLERKGWLETTSDLVYATLFFLMFLAIRMALAQAMSLAVYLFN